MTTKLMFCSSISIGIYLDLLADLRKKLKDLRKMELAQAGKYVEKEMKYPKYFTRRHGLVSLKFCVFIRSIFHMVCY